MIRPIICNGGNACAIAIKLENSSPFADGFDDLLLELEGNPKGLPVIHELSHSDAATILDPDKRPLLGDDTDVVRAFLRFLENLE